MEMLFVFHHMPLFPANVHVFIDIAVDYIMLAAQSRKKKMLLLSPAEER